jgi:beta-phosphoglucomutase family hydrolase
MSKDGLPFEIPPDVEGLIFDCDGTIADTMPLHYQAWVEALRDHGCEFSQALFYEMAGVTTVRIIQTLNERYGHSIPVAEAAERKERIYEQLIPKALPIEPVVECIRRYSGSLPMAVATGATRAICYKTLQSLGLLKMFKTIVAAEDVKHGKPAPDIFLEAARRLEVRPARCLVFEDGVPGIEAAKAAGMRVIDVRPWYQPR